MKFNVRSIQSKLLIGKTPRQTDIGHIRAPDLIWLAHGNTSKQLRIDLMFRVRTAGVRLIFWWLGMNAIVQIFDSEIPISLIQLM